MLIIIYANDRRRNQQPQMSKESSAQDQEIMQTCVVCYSNLMSESLPLYFIFIWLILLSPKTVSI